MSSSRRRSQSRSQRKPSSRIGLWSTLVIGAFAIAAVGALVFLRTQTADPDLHLEQARVLRANGDLHGAVTEVRNALAMDPELREGWIRLAELFTLLGDGERALGAVTKAESIDATPNPALRHARLEAMLSNGEYKRVVGRLSTQSKALSTHEYSVLGRAYSSMFQPDSALAAFEEGLVKQPGNDDLLEGLIAIHVDSGRLAKARELLEPRRTKAAERPATSLLIGQLALADRNLDAAESAFRAAARDPRYARRARVGLASTLLARNALDAAAVEIASLMAMSPKHPIINHLRGLHALRQGKLELAKEAFRTTLAADPKHTRARALLARTYFLSGQPDVGIQELELIQPFDAFSGAMLADAYLEAGREDEALHVLKSLDSAGLAGSKQLATLNRMLANRGADTEMMTRLSDAHHEGDADFQAEVQLALLQRRQGRDEEARATAARALSKARTPIERALAEALSAVSRGEPARDAWNGAAKTLVQHGDDANTLSLLGAIANADGRTDDARTAWKRALSIRPDLVLAHRGLADLAIRAGKPMLAERHLSAVLTKRPADLQANMAVATLWAIGGNRLRASKQLVRTARKHPRSAEIRVLQSSIALRDGKPADGLDFAGSAASLAPENPGVLQALMRAQLANGLREEADSTLTRWATVQPETPAGLAALGRAYATLGQNDAARRSFRKAVELVPDDQQSRYSLTLLEAAAGRTDVARKLANDLKRRAPTQPGGFVLEGNLWLSAGDRPKAVASYLQAGKRATTPEAALQVATYLEKAGAQEHARTLLERSLNAVTPTARVRFYLGRLLERMGHDELALGHYEDLSRGATPSVAALNNLAGLYMRRNDPRFLETAKRAHRLAPDSGPVLDTYGLALLRKGQTQQALAMLRKAYAAMPDQPSVGFHLATASLKAGDPILAKRVLTAIVEPPNAFPEREHAQRLLASLAQ